MYIKSCKNTGFYYNLDTEVFIDFKECIYE